MVISVCRAICLNIREACSVTVESGNQFHKSTSVLQAKCAAGKPTKAPDYIRVCMEWISYVYTVQKFEIKILLSYEEVMLIKAIYLINNTGRKTVMCVILLQVKITVSMLIYFKI